jgi:hypothetical protein
MKKQFFKYKLGIIPLYGDSCRASGILSALSGKNY